MKKVLILMLALVMVMGLAGISMATNGDNLIGIGAISRAMGGVGIAAPQDAISATFANPAGMCFGPYCPGSEVNFDGTAFIPSPSASVPGLANADSDSKVYPIPAFGFSVPINDRVRFGLSAYGTSGLGVDYKDTSFGPMAAYTNLQILKFSPNVAYRVNDNFSVGVGLHINYSNLDLAQGSEFGYGFGAQVGAIYKVNDNVSLGITYKTPQAVKHKNVADFDGNLIFDDLKLTSPQEVGVGVAFEPMPGLMLIEVDGKFINWKNAAGYKDFGWKNQWVVAVGAQVKPNDRVALRLGYNYGSNPVDEHPGWNSLGGTTVQGTPVPIFNYEYLRIIGFPAIVQHHVTAGVGFDINPNLSINLAYMHAFKEKITETDITSTYTLQSELSEDSVDFGITYRFQ